MSKKPPKEKNPNVVTTTVKHTIAIPLEDAELAKYAHSMANLDNQIVEMTLAHNDRVKPLKKKRKEISEMVFAGQEKRTVECQERKDYDANTVEYLLKGKVVEKRDMTADERQAEMKLKTKKLQSSIDAAERQALIDMSKEPAKSNVKKVDFKKRASGEKDDEVGEDIESIIKAETRKGTKRSSVDGPTSDKHE